MNKGMRNDREQWKSPTGDKLKVPSHHWVDLREKERAKVCENALATVHPPEGFIVPFLGGRILVDLAERCLKKRGQGTWEKIDYPLLELLSLVYLLNAGPNTLSHEMVSTQQLKTSHFFQGPHELNIRPLIERFGEDVEAFKRAASSLRGEDQHLADASFRIVTFPKVPLYYLLWKGDEEFEPRLSVLFDRSIENHLSADAIWGLVNLVSEALLRAPTLPF